MEIKQHQYVITSLALIRKETATHLPIGHSFIPYDILITVVINFTNDKELTVKALFATLPYSDSGLRYHFQKLVDTGWIELHAVNGDARVKQVKPTEKLSNQFGQLSANLSPFFSSSNNQIQALSVQRA